MGGAPPWTVPLCGFFRVAALGRTAPHQSCPSKAVAYRYVVQCGVRGLIAALSDAESGLPHRGADLAEESEDTTPCTAP